MDSKKFQIIHPPKKKWLAKTEKVCSELIQFAAAFDGALGLVVLAIAFPLLSIIIIGRKIHPVTNRFKKMGTLAISGGQLNISYLTGGEENHNLSQIQRIDIYPGRGFEPWDRYKENGIFKGTLVLRVRITVNGQQESIFVKNNTEGITNTGELFHQLQALRKLNVNYYRKIQFWDKV